MIADPGVKEEPQIEDVFTQWDRLVSPGTFDGLELPAAVMFDTDRTHLWWLWHLSMPRSSVEALKMLLEDLFEAIPEGASWPNVDEIIRKAITEFKAKNNVTPLIPWQEWKAVSMLHAINDETFSLAAVIETVRATEDDGKWKRIIEACTSLPTRPDIKKVTPYIQKCVKSKC